MDANSPPILRKRRKKVIPSGRCANPQFLKWLEEWRDEAASNGSKLKYVYAKAIISLKKYPMPLKCGREAKILENFGDKICQMLDARSAAEKNESQDVDEDEQRNVSPQKETLGGGTSHQLHDKPSEISVEHHEPRLLQFWYIDDSGSAVRSKDGAAVSIDGDIGVGFKIKCRQLELSKLKTKYKLADVGTSDDKHVIAFITDSDAPEYCNPPVSIPASSNKITTISPLKETAETKQRKPRMKSNPPDLPHPNIQLTHPPSDSQLSQVSMTSSDNSQPTSITESDQSTQPDVDLSQNILFSLSPDQYDILLCVDSAETTGGRAGSKKATLIPELEHSGCPFEIRKLHVGDFAWIAKPKPGFGGQELVLDFIVERKRIDDLCHSITDGRFREQKFRLKKCGLRKPIYLVEDYGKVAQHLRLPEQTLTQALINTQVVDGLIVKRTPDLKSSVNYLTTLTHYLIQSHRTKTLRCCPGELVTKSKEVFDISSQSIYLMSFSDFNQSSMKHKTITVSDMFAKHLMQIKGVSASKASTIITVYKTPRSLLEAYDTCSSKLEKEKLLASLKHGSLNRNIGPAVSKSISIVYAAGMS